MGCRSPRGRAILGVVCPIEKKSGAFATVYAKMAEPFEMPFWG